MSDNAKRMVDYNPTAYDLIPEQQTPDNVSSVSPNDTVQSAFTTMVLYDYSQLPVVCDGKVTGVVKWTALATVCSSGSAVNATIGEYAEKPQTIRANEPWEKATEIVAKGDYAIVVNNDDDDLLGIITASDMADRLQSCVEPIANIQRIEDGLRKINGTCIKSGCQVPSLKDQIDDLKKWISLRTKLDCDTVIDALTKAKDTRDNMAHFKPEGISEWDRENLRRCAAMIESIQKCQRAQCNC